MNNLDALFAPRSIGVVGASIKEDSVGGVLFKNLLRGHYSGIVSPINPKYRSVQGVRAYARVSDVEEPPDLGVVCTPPAIVPQVVRELAEAGARAAIVITAGITDDSADGEPSLRAQMLEAARSTGMRLLGPNCVGLLAPWSGLNCSFAHTDALPGHLAFLSQSGGLTTSVLDWAKGQGFGFSSFVSLGDSLDIDAGDLLDYLSNDPQTNAILLYLESVSEARHFLAAARAAARVKPVVVIKAGREAEGARAAASHTGALAGSDEVYDAALGRAGMLRVLEIEELFDAVETLALAEPPRGERVAILTNGGGPAVMATDALIEANGTLAQLSTETIAQLDASLPPTWSRGNPVDIIGDASPDRYATSLRILLDDAGVDSVIVLHVPVALTKGSDVARAVVRVIGGRPPHPQVLSCWLGGPAAEEPRRILQEAGIPSYPTPEQAVRAFQQLTAYQRNQKRLAEAPSYAETPSNRAAAVAIVEGALGDGREWLNERECEALLSAYGIPAVESGLATTPEEATGIADRLGYPVALKLISPDVRHKTDVGGVKLDLASDEELVGAWRDMTDRLSELRPSARVDGFLVQQMARRPEALELIVGVSTDVVFGPVILFGEGGTAVEVIADRAVELPPLNPRLALDMVSRTQVSRRLSGYRNRLAADHEEIGRVLVAVSQLVTELPQVRELDLNPLLADHKGVVVLDVRVRVAEDHRAPGSNLAIPPYNDRSKEALNFHNGADFPQRRDAESGR